MRNQHEFPMMSNDKRTPALTDDDLMSFGKFKGTPMRDVPCDYLYWLWHNLNLKPELKNYIWNCQEDLKQELGEKWIGL